ncbi:UDP-N-acetylmuramoylalanyl-D-glutamyl-2, 6-diaminopimelate--D-alanyl-D-alanine ligase [Rhodospirillum rubrum]|uniref:UDP-N-acetylmuramoyl-tripeptide--D-alanyl-D- alanine ligase n=1 Tax=Rhodospirillum rubrum TaxID=1085 RepID=UPI0019086FA3|nr:UDP-N-acetylmuramoyl-tripeptide--D-alanyl-D-alanine ligase [Rhodospirillum rubrum]MBK1663971.1 UDP-N-acetylmuramoylalanyl-D-glutamyl-2, 6-diaminopimelate--D-alanyl-D-alanine ligase [Rhodospirillum rubrum]MBK1677535.1 UDP-N-acetylmuramoylalanyl-D-glutamyl-2, 6-diaminopimelate--D-alanyl-D-alanine ligase [Rhodospirillum rubrum]
MSISPTPVERGTPAVLWTAATAAAALGIPASGAWTATGVCIDSRAVVAGDLFIALTGERTDGHAHVAAALAAGASAALVSRIPAGIATDRLLVVEDTLEGLWALARASRARFAGRLVGVTGSLGKTGTKEMLTQALGRFGRVHATEGNLNNHFGLPLTLARMPVDTDLAVIELGMNHPGELGPLARLARPHVAIITNVAAVHLEFFASVEAIADAKAEILEGVEPGGTVVLNRDNRFFERLRRAAAARGIDKTLSFGNHIGADARVLDCAVDANGTAVFALIGDDPLAYRMAVEGRHWALNSLGVLAVVHALGLDIHSAANGLANVVPPRGRGRRQSVSLDGDGAVQVIDDAYNASPESVIAALTTLSMTRPGPRGRRIAVLGDMLELGPQAAKLHADLAKISVERGIDLVYTAGPLMAHLHDALPASRRGGHAPDADALTPLVLAALRPGDVVMIKGSKGSLVSRTVTALLALDRRAEAGLSAADTP